MPSENLSSKAKPNFFSRLFFNDRSRAAWGKEVSGTELNWSHEFARSNNVNLKHWFNQVFSMHLSEFAAGETSIELGSGGSQLKRLCPKLITSDLMAAPGVDKILDACHMDVSDGTVDNLTLINVLHHLPRPLNFFSEAQRVLRVGGRLILTEPYVSLSSYPVYRWLHHEPCHMHKQILKLSNNNDPLLCSNQAMPTQLFSQYFDHVQKAAPDLRVVKIQFHSWISYYLTGGVNYSSLVPERIWKWIARLDSVLCRSFGRYLGGFMFVVMEKMPPDSRVSPQLQSR